MKVEEIVADVLEHADRAQAFREDNPAVALQELRKATEGVLHAACLVSGVSAKRSDPGTIHIYQNILRNQKLLTPSIEKHLKTLQTYSNSASHFQPERGERSGGTEVQISLMAFEQLLLAVRRQWPGLQSLRWSAAGTAPSARGTDVATEVGDHVMQAHREAPEPTLQGEQKTSTPMVLALAVLVAIAGFFATVWLFGVKDAPPENPTDDPSVVEEPSAVTPPEEEEKPAEEAKSWSTRAQSFASQIRLKQALPDVGMEELNCEELNFVRNWIWASRGYTFEDPETLAIFTQEIAYTPRGTSIQEVRVGFTPVDRKNLKRLRGEMRSKKCPCADASQAQPCPL